MYANTGLALPNCVAGLYIVPTWCCVIDQLRVDLGSSPKDLDTPNRLGYCEECPSFTLADLYDNSVMDVFGFVCWGFASWKQLR